MQEKQQKITIDNCTFILPKQIPKIDETKEHEFYERLALILYNSRKSV